MITESYLINRKQRLVLNSQTSSWENILAGDPRSSVLVSILIIIYVNNLPD